MEIKINYDHDKAELSQMPLEELAIFTLVYNKAPDNCEVSISFVDDETIAELNKTYRKKEGSTDVLSFECDTFPEAASDASGKVSPVFLLGDVVIAPDVAQRQRQEFETEFEEEITLLLVHGLLHLCGYDHIRDEEAEVMESLEAEILEAWAQR